MTETEAIHTRLNYMEEKFDTKLGQMADSVSRMAESIEKLSERAADVSLLMERSNQHGLQIDHIDQRVDVIEQKMPLITRFMDRADKVSLAVIILLITGMVGSFFAFG